MKNEANMKTESYRKNFQMKCYKETVIKLKNFEDGETQIQTKQCLVSMLNVLMLMNCFPCSKNKDVKFIMSK